MTGAQLSETTLESVRRSLAGTYELAEVIGHGGMAVVFRAHHRESGREMAIKLLRPELAALLGPRRFLREIRCAASFQHPGIVPLLEWGSAADLPYYVMPFVEGDTLRGRLEREQTLDLAEAVKIASEVALALDHAHGKGIVHRDIKPDNLFLTDGGVLVADFGVAYIINELAGDRITDPALAIGTPEYMSPEQAEGAQIDQRSDVYSLACVVYEMLAGIPPITGRTVQQVLARKARQQPPSLALMRADIPPGLARVVATGLARSPGYRFSRATDLTQALRRTMDGAVNPVG